MTLQDVIKFQLGLCDLKLATAMILHTEAARELGKNFDSSRRFQHEGVDMLRKAASIFDLLVDAEVLRLADANLGAKGKSQAVVGVHCVVTRDSATANLNRRRSKREVQNA